MESMLCSRNNLVFRGKITCHSYYYIASMLEPQPFWAQLYVHNIVTLVASCHLWKASDYQGNGLMDIHQPRFNWSPDLHISVWMHPFLEPPLSLINCDASFLAYSAYRTQGHTKSVNGELYQVIVALPLRYGLPTKKQAYKLNRQ